MSEKERKNISRRSFIKGVGITTAGAAALNSGVMAKQLEKSGLINDSNIVPEEGIKTVLEVNGKRVKVLLEPRTTLADALRIDVHLTGTKIGCNRGACGACTVLLNGKPVNSCMTLALDAVGLPITTIEGVETNGELDAIQNAFIENDAMQCGFCTSGMVISSKALLDSNPNPNEEEILEAVSGNLCRCGTYPHVVNAIKDTANGKVK